MRCACIDIGSNTTRLLVAERGAGGLSEVASRRTHLPLCSPDGVIVPARIAEVAAEVAFQVELARRAGARRIRLVATAAVRSAANGHELCAAVAAASGLDVTVLSGDEEARLAFSGALRSLGGAPRGAMAVVDVGGGSTEIVCGTAAGGVAWSTSLPIGSGLLADRCLHGDPPSTDELERVRADVRAAFAGLRPPPVAEAYAVGGSAASLRRVLGSSLDHEVLEAGVRRLTALPAHAVATQLDLQVDRVRVLPASMLLLAAASAVLGRPLGIVAGGLREGVVLAQAEGLAA